MESESAIAIRAVLQAFQDGYTARDAARLPEVAALFAADAAVEVIGTGACEPGEGEWCLGPDAAERLVRLDWEGWGDLRLDVAGARIHARGEVAWLATAATVTMTLEREAVRREFLDYARSLALSEESPAEARILEILRSGTNALYEIQRGERYVWPLRFSAVLVREPGGWKFHQMQFSFPTTRYPDERLADDSPPLN
jgi:hypothetical protein